MKKIVTIGGGTGSYTVLSGIKDFFWVSITSIVSMADDGGSTGVLKDELGVLPAGDVRQCLVALSEHSEIVRELMNYRFDEGSLKGHSFGNIFLAALEKVTGNFAEGVEVASEVLKIKGKVIPITHDPAKLVVGLSSGDIVEGEDNIQNTDLQTLGLKRIFYKSDVLLDEHAKEPLLEADFIILGPGNYYCSVIPNLIVNGFKKIIKESEAKIIFPINLTNKQGHTVGWKASNYVKDIEKYLGRTVDIILVNNQKPTDEQIKAYELEEGSGVLVEDDLGSDSRVIRAPLLSTVMHQPQNGDVIKAERGFIRHDSKKLAECIDDLI